MRLAYYKAKHGNFGDDLNQWLWPRLFPRIEEGDESTVLVGIGTILGNRVAAGAERKIVFGSGIRRPSGAPLLDASWDVRFVRGPITAASLGFGEERVISDGAICLGLLPMESAEPVWETGFVPHIHFVDHYPGVLEMKGDFHVIDPRLPVDDAIRDIRKCRRIIAESLHGAILADLYRIPWARVALYSWQTESPDVSSLKWLDWGLSMKVDSFPTATAAVPAFSHRFSRVRRQLIAAHVLRKVRALLNEMSRNEKAFRLSGEAMMQWRLGQARQAVEDFGRDYALF